MDIEGRQCAGGLEQQREVLGRLPEGVADDRLQSLGLRPFVRVGEEGPAVIEEGLGAGRRARGALGRSRGKQPLRGGAHPGSAPRLG